VKSKNVNPPPTTIARRSQLSACSDGLGSTLLAAAEERLRALGIRQMNLMVYEHNGPAEAMYLRRGYERSPVKVLRKRFGEG
jgi:GNAT superfamily N-acetyltransferase